MFGFPNDVIPTGWYQVAWAGEIGVGQVTPLRYFSEDLVAYRGTSGEVCVMNAHCPHLGAHLGYGGKVAGDDIICPFHGWRWDSKGCNVEIPYGTRTNRAQVIRTWHVREHYDLVLVWYDALERDPQWEPPAIEEYDEPDRYPPFPHCVRKWDNVRLIPQFIAENAVDPAHQQYVHGAFEPSTMELHESEGPRFHSVQKMTFGKGKPSTWLTPDGAVEATLDAEVWGMGLIVARFQGTDDSIHIQCQTPVEADRCDLRVSVLARRDPGDHSDAPSGASARRMEFQWRQVDNDLLIWEHMHYVERPPLASVEARAYTDFRRWAAQFYPEVGTDVQVTAGRA